MFWEISFGEIKPIHSFYSKATVFRAVRALDCPPEYCVQYTPVGVDTPNRPQPVKWVKHWTIWYTCINDWGKSGAVALQERCKVVWGDYPGVDMVNMGIFPLKDFGPPPSQKCAKLKLIVYIDIVAHALYSYARKSVESESI